MGYLKSEAPPEVLETVRQVDVQADESWRTLQILENPLNVAIWALLTGGIAAVERGNLTLAELVKRGSRLVRAGVPGDERGGAFVLPVRAPAGLETFQEVSRHLRRRGGIVEDRFWCAD